MLKKNGIDVVVISKEKNKVVQARCEKLKIECWQGIDHKIEIFSKIIAKKGLDKNQVCFIGNDINDIDCIKAAGMGVVVADAYNEVVKFADYITAKKGGYGAVREVADIILKHLN